MGDVIKSFAVRGRSGERPRRLRLYFDSGSPYTFIKLSAARAFANVFPLAAPERFGGLGEGVFHATHLMNMEVRLLGVWCRHPAYVVGDQVLTEAEDVLVGHDFMQKFDVNILPRRHDVSLNKAALRRAQVVRSTTRRGRNSSSPDDPPRGSRPRS